MLMAGNYYDAISESYDELHGEEQRKKYTAISSNLNLEAGSTILDMGHGSGIIACVFSDFDITGIDNSEKLIEKSKCRTMQWDFNELPLPFEDKSFDAVMCVTAFHHSDNYKALALEMKRLTRKCVAVSLLKKSEGIQEQKKTLMSVFSKAELYDIGIDELMIAWL